ncbi:hypothetical protein JCM16303_003955 [Sporobolomyces ruberrimus]
MPMQSLPTELLRHVLTLAIEDFPRRALGPEDRPGTLCSFALVHSSWTPIAQELLWRTITLTGERERLERRGSLVRAGFGRFKPRNLHLEGSLRVLLETMGTEMWSRVTLLDYFEYDGETDLSLLAAFPRLEKLRIYAESRFYELSTFSASLSFPALRKLRLTCVKDRSGELSHYQQLFSPAHLPSLVHLTLDLYTLDGWDEILSELYPQIRTLAISNPRNIGPITSQSFAPFKDVSRWKKLKRLEYEQNDDKNFLAALLNTAGHGLELDLFKVSLHGWPPEEAMPRLFAISRGDDKSFKVKRMVFCGKTERSFRWFQPDVNLDEIKWEWGGEEQHHEFI